MGDYKMKLYLLDQIYLLDHCVEGSETFGSSNWLGIKPVQLYVSFINIGSQARAKKLQRESNHTARSLTFVEIVYNLNGGY